MSSSFNIPSNPNKVETPGIQTPQAAPANFPKVGGSGGGGGGWGAFEQYMGEENFRKFQQNICSSIAQQIGHDQQRQKEASRALRRSETGEDMYDSS
jgi:hypothetical protein